MSSIQKYEPPSRLSMPEKIKYANELAAADLLPGDYRRKPGNVLLAVEYGEMLGLHTLTAIQQVHVIKGKLTMSAELMRAQVLRHGHKFRTLEMTSDRSVVSIERGDDPGYPTTVEFTMADAKAAGLLSNDTWQKFPKSMLHARATSMAVRAVCPEVLMGISYTPDELGATVDPETGDVIDVASEPLVLATQAQIDRIMELSGLLDDTGRDEMAAWKEREGVDPKSMTPSQAAAAIVELERLVAANPSGPDDDGPSGVPEPAPEPVPVDDGIVEAVIVEPAPEPEPVVVAAADPATVEPPVADAVEVPPTSTASAPTLNERGFPVATRAELEVLMEQAGKTPTKVMLAARNICQTNSLTLPESFDKLTDGPLLDEVCNWLRVDVLGGVPPMPPAEVGDAARKKAQRRMHALAAKVWPGDKAEREAQRKALVAHVTAGRTDSSSACDLDELDTVCGFLAEMERGEAVFVDGQVRYVEGAA